jgi:predicted PurR-regulated permease PerM
MSSENTLPNPVPPARERFRLPHRDFIQKILIVIMFAGVLLVLWQGAEILLLVFAGLLLAIFLRSASGFLSRHAGLSDKWGFVLVMLVIVGIAALGVWLLSGSVERQFGELTERLPVAFEQARGRLAEYPLGRKIVEYIPAPQQIIFGRQSGNVFGRITGFFSTAFDTAVNVLIVLITGVYFALNPNNYREGGIMLFPKSREKRVREVLYTIVFTLRRFLLGISISMMINFTLTALGLWLLGVPFAVPLGVIAGLLTFIPNIGPVIAGVPAVLIAFSQNPRDALYVLLLYLVIQNLDGFVITPLVQQRAISVPPVLVVAGQLLLGVIFGFLGLLLAVPLVAVLFVMVKMIYVEDVLMREALVKGESEAQKKT